MFTYQLAVLILLSGIAVMAAFNHRAYRRPGRAPGNSGEPPLVSVLVPARNEEANIGPCLEGLLRQDYPRWELLVLDDASTDRTAAEARRVFESVLGQRQLRARLLEGEGLPPGWAGKAHACWELAQEARGDWLLFLDADTRHASDLLSRGVAEAERTGVDLLSTFPRQEVRSIGEALTVPFIYWVLFTLLPIGPAMRSRSPAMTAACGQFLLVRREAYLATGGHAAIRASLHDGLHLARLLKRCGLRVGLADLSGSISCRMYRGWRECWDGFSRNAYQALGSFPALLFVSLLETALFLLPVPFLLAAVLGGYGWGWLVVAQVLLLLGIQVSLKRRFGYPWLTVLLHPVGIAALIAIQWASWWRSFRGAPGAWKGRQLSRQTGASGC